MITLLFYFVGSDEKTQAGRKQPETVLKLHPSLRVENMIR